jgi:triacylglycerol lipase
VGVTAFCLLGTLASAEPPNAALEARLDALEANVTAAEDLSALKRLQREYGYYVDKGLWEDVADLYADDAVANYPAGTYVGKASIRRHLYMNVGGGQIGENGLPDGRLYNHINIQPVVHLDPGGQTAKGRWRAFAMLGSFGGGATWAEGVYEMTYAKDHGVWKIRNLDYHSGFGAPYATGWVPPEPRSAAGGGQARGGARSLPYPADKPREEACPGFPAACVGPFHYTNPGVTDAGHVWTRVALPAAGGRKPAAHDRASALAERVQRLADEQEIENLQKIYGYYLDRRMWNDVADLFTDDGTIEMGQQGVYVGKKRVRAFLDLLGPAGIGDGIVNDHVQLQIVVDVAPDGRTAKARSRELNMTGELDKHGEWSEGVYAIYPKAHIPPYHYDNPVTRAAPRYPEGRGRPTAGAIAAIRAPVAFKGARARKPESRDVSALVHETEVAVGRVKDFHEIDNLVSAYGYYLDKNLWNDLANLFSANGSIELAQRGSYIGRERVRGFLFNVFGKEGPAENRLGNHIQYQAVIHVAGDGQTAKVRSRMLQQLNFGQRASMGASLYENEFIKEDGVWKFSVDHTFNTWTAGYEGGWARNPGRTVPGPSKSYPPDTPPTFVFQMFPTVYEIPFHYVHPVTGRQTGKVRPNPERASTVHTPSSDLGMPADIAAELRTIGPRIEAEKTAKLYAPLQPKEPYPWLKVVRDVRYGPAERNVLDVFTTPVPGSGKPVVVFVHGGGFARGAKRVEGTPFYDNIGLWAEGYGLVGVTVNYRLAPQSVWPSGIEDMGAVVAWLREHAAVFGGDPNRIVLWGHSAGAAHVGDYLASVARRGGAPGIAGAVLTSGFYDLGSEVSVWKVYYGDDVTKYGERSSLPGLVKTDVPLLVTDAEIDPEMFRTETQKLLDARRAAGKTTAHVQAPGHSHISETYGVGTGDRSLSGPVLEFVRSVTGEAHQ